MIWTVFKFIYAIVCGTLVAVYVNTGEPFLLAAAVLAAFATLDCLLHDALAD